MGDSVKGGELTNRSFTAEGRSDLGAYQVLWLASVGGGDFG